MCTPCNARERTFPVRHKKSCLFVPLVAMLAGQSLVANAQGGSAPDVSPTAAAQTIEPYALVPNVKEQRASERRDAVAEALDTPPLEEPEVPGLIRRADGSYRFQGTNISAVIAKDGKVSFRDRFLGVERRMKPLAAPPQDSDPTTSGARTPQSPPWLALQFRIDLQAYLESKFGNDPYLAERRWFMERTRELRESLMQRALASSLRTALSHIWTDAGLSLAARKRETFELWNNSNADEEGKTVRSAVEAFVRDRCPRGSSCEFRPSELKRFNDKRTHKTSFMPYAIPRASTTRASAPH